jgi:hypothetical protein
MKALADLTPKERAELKKHLFKLAESEHLFPGYLGNKTASSSPSQPRAAVARPRKRPKQPFESIRAIVALDTMKMFAAVSSPITGTATVTEIATKISDSVESKDLLVRLVK